MTHPGESINFDGQDLQEEQEEELAFEDRHREQELRDLLSKALPDDLLEDDIQSIPSSRDSSILSSGSPDLSPRQQSPPVDDQHQWLYKADAYQQASTPHVWGGAPPLKTPAGVALRPESGQPEPRVKAPEHTPHHTQPAQSNGLHTPDDSHNWLYEHNDIHLQVPEPNANPYSQGLSPTTHAWDAARRDSYGNGANSNGNSDDDSEHGHGVQHYEEGQAEDWQEQYQPENQDRMRFGNGVGNVNHKQDFHYLVAGRQLVEHSDEERRYSQHYEPPKSTKPKPALSAPNASTRMGHDHSRPTQDGRLVIQHASSEPNMDLVLYQGRGRDEEVHHYRHERVTDLYQAEFISAGNMGRDAAQLEILFQARGREIQQLTAQLETLGEESARQKRILNHQLAMAQDERDGLGVTYREGQELVNKLSSEASALKGQLQALQQEIQTLTQTNQQLHSELDTANATIESLNHQLSELHRSQPLHKAREQQESLLTGLQQKFSQETADLREKLDAASGLASQKSALVEQLDARLSVALKGADLARLEHAETVNRLSASLQDNQKRCQELLLQGTAPVEQELLVKLQEASSAKTMAENMCQLLREEVADLKDQVMLYEGAVDLGVIPGSGVKVPSPTTPSDADIVRNLAKEDWKTPQPAGLARSQKEPLSPEETRVKLRAELGRSLQSIRAKREQVSRLQVELREARQEGQTWRDKGDSAEARVKQLQSEVETLKKAISETSSQTLSPDQQKEVQTMRAKLDAKTRACGDMEEKMETLKREMAQMVAENDQDKKEAVERCQKTCLQLHEDSSRNLREELVNELQAEKQTLAEAHQYQLQQVRNEMVELEKELHSTKELYLELSQEKKALEENTEKRIADECKGTMEKIKVVLEKEKTDALENMKSSLEASHRAEIVLLQEKLKKEKEEELEQLKADQTAATKQVIEEYEKEMDSLKSKHEELQKNLEALTADAQIERRTQESQANIDGPSGDMESELEALRVKCSGLEASIPIQVSSAVESAKEQWLRLENQRRMSLDRVAASAIEQLKADQAVELAEWQGRCTDREGEVSDRIAAAVNEARHAWNKEEQSRRRESLDRRKAEEAKHDSESLEERQRLSQQVQRAREALGVAQRDSSQVRAKYGHLRARHDKEVARLRDELKACQAKLQQAERTLQEELEQLQSDMREANSVTMESMQERVSAIQQKHALVVEKMKAEWEEERQRWRKESGKQKNVTSSAIQTLPSSESELVTELRTHYLHSVENVRASAMSYVADMQKRCQETLRAAVIEERQRVATKMRLFYTKQVQSVRQNKRVEKADSLKTQPPQCPVGESSANSLRTSGASSQQLDGKTGPLPRTNHDALPTGSRDGTDRTSIRRGNSSETISQVRRKGIASDAGFAVRNMSPPSHAHQKARGNQDSDDHTVVHFPPKRALQPSSKNASGSRVGQAQNKQPSHTGRGRSFGEEAMADMPHNAPALHYFTEEDIGKNSATLLKEGSLAQQLPRDAFSSSLSMDTSTNGGVNPNEPSLNTQTQRQGHITVRRRSSSSSGQAPIHNRQSRVVTSKEQTPSNVPPKVLSGSSEPSRNVHHSTQHYRRDPQFVPHQSQTTPTYQNGFESDVNLSVGSLGSEYAELPQSLADQGEPAAFPSHSFLAPDFTKSAQFPKRFAELQGSMLGSLPVRDTNTQSVYFAQGFTGEVVLGEKTLEVTKSSSKNSNSVYEDSGINSPTSMQPSAQFR